ncbi:MAG: glutamyl-tRNA reductase [Cyanobacteriota bacterium]
MHMLATGMSYKTSPVEIREKIAFGELETESAIKKLYSYDSIVELVMLSTCNRTEFYIITNDIDKAFDDLADFIKTEKNIDYDDIKSYFYTHHNKSAAEHLYNVSGGIDSVIIGEGEILSQVKSAFHTALYSETTGKIFNSLFKFAIETGKRVRTDTSIAQRPISAGSLAVKIVKDSFKDFQNKSVLVVGAGKINQIVSKNLKSAGVTKGIIINRTYEKAEKLADELNWEKETFDKLDELIPNYDIIIVGIGVKDYLITQDNFKNNKEKVVVIDLSVPRNVDSNIKKNKNVVFYDNELLEKVIEINKDERIRITEEAKTIINQEMSKFLNWYNAFEVSPIISSLSVFMEGIRKNELDRTVKKNSFNDEQLNALEVLTKSIVQKIMHYPVTNLKMTDNKEEQLKYAESVKYLFQLENEDEYDKYVKTENKDKKDEKQTCPFSLVTNIGIPQNIKSQIMSQKNVHTVIKSNFDKH